MTHAELKDNIQRLNQATDKITGWLAELDDRACEIDLFYLKGNLLQAAIDAKEAYAVITELAKQLFPKEAGALYLRNISNMEDRFEPVAAWPVSPREKNGFTSADCWALKSGKPHLVDADSPGPTCNHVHASSSSGYLCVPMIAHGEALGVLHLKHAASGRTESNGHRAGLSSAKQRLAVALAGHIALAIANLRLRDLLINQATRDPLTGLYNRRYLDEILERELQRAKREERKAAEVKPVGLIYFDVDHFGRYNKPPLSQEAGDTVLRTLGAFLQSEFCRRPGDIVCRIAGDEFVIVLPGASLENSRQRAEALRKGVKHLRPQHEDKPLKQLSLSLGVACYPVNALEADVLIKAAAAALSEAKKKRDRAVSAKPRQALRGERR